MTLPATIRAIEEIAMAAQPALWTLNYDGWVLRFSEGHTRRANSVHPLYPSTLEVGEKIARCREIYEAQGLPLVFKMTAAAEPAGLDTALEEMGITTSATTSVQVRNLDGPLDEPLQPVTLTGRPTGGWLDAFCRLTGVPPPRRDVLTRMLDGIFTPAAYASVTVDGDVVAVGLGVAVNGWVGIYDIATAEPLRRRGLGRDVVGALLQWGREAGAADAYLQVMVDNIPALALYDKLGFEEMYRYWYRSGDSGSGGR